MNPVNKFSPSTGTIKAQEHSQNFFEYERGDSGISAAIHIPVPQINFCPSESLVLHALHAREEKRPQQDATCLWLLWKRSSILPISHPPDTSVPKSWAVEGQAPTALPQDRPALPCKNSSCYQGTLEHTRFYPGLKETWEVLSFLLHTRRKWNFCT